MGRKSSREKQREMDAILDDIIEQETAEMEEMNNFSMEGYAPTVIVNDKSEIPDEVDETTIFIVQDDPDGKFVRMRYSKDDPEREAKYE